MLHVESGKTACELQTKNSGSRSPANPNAEHPKCSVSLDIGICVLGFAWNLEFGIWDLGV